MPTYKAAGVTATLRTCDLVSSVQNELDLGMVKPNYHSNMEAIGNMFTNAPQLPERPVADDGGVKGVMQFIGENGDMPLYVAEAGDGVQRNTFDEAQDEMEGVQMTRTYSSNMLNMSDDSPLTSLTATPTSTGQMFAGTSPSNGAGTFAVEPLSANGGQALAARLASLRGGPEQALVLDIQLSRNAFLPDDDGCKDVKVEVFVNGDLADVVFIPRREPHLQKAIYLSGTRFHRQLEKPWIYAPSSTAGVQTLAASQWDAVSKALAAEVRSRGRDTFGGMQPSAEYLAALAMYQLPDRIKTHSNIGIIDIVITAGKGSKCGSGSYYIGCPTRMGNPESTILPGLCSPALNMAHKTNNDRFSPADSVIQQSFEPSLQSSPDIPLREVRKPPNSVLSPSKKTVDDLVEELGLKGGPDKIKLGAWEKTSGRRGQSGRTLKQRLGDIGKMSPANQVQKMELLRTELGLGEKDGKESDETAKNQLKLDHVGDIPIVPEAPALDDPFVDQRDETMSPTDMHKIWAPDARPTPEPVVDPALLAMDSEAVLTQTRIDMALLAGLPSDGALLRRIASTSPMSTPRKITKASSLANSPTSTPVKPQTKAGRPPSTPTPQRTGHLLSTQDSPLSSAGPTPRTASSAKLAKTATQSGRAKARTAGTPSRRAKATPKSSGGAKRFIEQREVDEAFEAFGFPEHWVESCVTYTSNEKVMRQIKKQRPGVFEEEMLVTGMRFIVV